MLCSRLTWSRLIAAVEYGERINDANDTVRMAHWEVANIHWRTAIWPVSYDSGLWRAPHRHAHSTGTGSHSPTKPPRQPMQTATSRAMLLSSAEPRQLGFLANCEFRRSFPRRELLHHRQPWPSSAGIQSSHFSMILVKDCRETSRPSGSSILASFARCVIVQPRHPETKRREQTNGGRLNTSHAPADRPGAHVSFTRCPQSPPHISLVGIALFEHDVACRVRDCPVDGVVSGEKMALMLALALSLSAPASYDKWLDRRDQLLVDGKPDALADRQSKTAEPG